MSITTLPRKWKLRGSIFCPRLHSYEANQTQLQSLCVTGPASLHFLLSFTLIHGITPGLVSRRQPHSLDLTIGNIWEDGSPYAL